MNNYFFPEKKIKFLDFFFSKNQNFVFRRNIEIKEDLNNKTLIKEDIYGQQNHSEICVKSFKISNKVKLSNYNSKNKLLDKVLKKKLIINIEEILRVTFLLEKIKSQYNLQNLYLCKLFQDLKLFNYLKKNNYISKKINISKTYFYLNKLLYFATNIYFFLNLFFLPEKIFLFCRKNSKKKKYFTMLNFDNFPNLNHNSDFLTILSKIKKPFILVEELKIRESFFFKKKKDKNLQNALNISEVFKNISFLSYVLKFYKKFFFERFQLIFSFNQNYKEKYRYFSNKICWEVFFHCFEVKKCMTAMLPCDLTSQIIQKEHSKETLFFYFSSTYNSLKSADDNDYVSNLQYNHMHYTSLITNKVSINYLNKTSNYFDKILQFKSARTYLGSKSKRNILLFKKKFNLENKKIIAIFDNSFEITGVLNSNEYLDFLKYFYFLIKKYNNFHFILIKKDKNHFYTSNIDNSKKLNFMLNQMNSFNNFIDLKYKLTALEVINLSDIILTHPNSSITEECLSLGKTTAIYDNTKIYYSNEEYTKISKRTNIYNIKYKYRLLDKDILNLLKINSNEFIKTNGDKSISNLINYLNQ